MRLEEAKRNVKTYIEDGLLKTGDKDAAMFVDFFMANAESSLRTASILQEISDENSLKEIMKVSSDFEPYLWVIVSSYYSMFYSATAILAKQVKMEILVRLRELVNSILSFDFNFLGCALKILHKLLVQPVTDVCPI